MSGSGDIAHVTGACAEVILGGTVTSMYALSRWRATWRRPILVVLALVLAMAGMSAFTASTAQATPLGGPVILGGEDMTDHGSYDGTDNQNGWLYIEKAIANIKPKVNRVGADGSIAALGSTDPSFDPTQSYSGDAGAAIASAGVKNSMPVHYYPGDTEIESFFDALRAGTVNPSIIWIAGNDASNDLSSNGGATALSNNASTIGDFVNSGGGLMSHGTEYGWLGGVLPGVTMGCSGGGDGDLELTTDGQAAFPGLTNPDVNAGPWHGCFDGDIGDLDVLVKSTAVTDAQNNPARVIIGGAAVTLPGSITLTPATATNPVGTSHTVTATVHNGDGSAKPGVTVSFSVSAGPDSGATGSGTTDASGQATYTYTNNGTAGTDTIDASFTDGNTTYKATASKTWEHGAPAAGSIELTPATADNPVGTDHTVTATVKNSAGDPQAGVTVTFDVTAGPDTGATGTGTTDADGKAEFTYTNNENPGTDTIEASFEDNGTTRRATATKTWTAAQYGSQSSATGQGTTECRSYATYRYGAPCSWSFRFDVTKSHGVVHGSVSITSPSGRTFKGTRLTRFSKVTNTGRFGAWGKWRGRTGYHLAAKVVDDSPDTVTFKIYKGSRLVTQVNKPVATGDVTVS